MRRCLACWFACGFVAIASTDRQKGIIRPRRPVQGGFTVGGQPIPESGPPASSQP